MPRETTFNQKPQRNPSADGYLCATPLFSCGLITKRKCRSQSNGSRKFAGREACCTVATSTRAERRSAMAPIGYIDHDCI